MSQTLSCIKGSITSEDAEAIVGRASGDFPRARTRLFYPYYWFSIRSSATTWLGRTGMSVSCLIDARRGIGATSDRFEVESREVDAGERLGEKLDEPEAERLARRYVSYVLRHRHRALVSPRLETLSRALVYRPFWIVDGGGHGEPWPVLVDGVTGGFHVLDVS